MLLLLVHLARADQLVSGDELRVYFDSTGTWNDKDAGAGIQALHEGEWLDWAYAGIPWQTLAVEYSAGDNLAAWYANSNLATATFTVASEADVSTDTEAAAAYGYTATGLVLDQR